MNGKMKRVWTGIVLCVMLPLYGNDKTVMEKDMSGPHIIPAPASLVVNGGAFVINDKTQIITSWGRDDKRTAFMLAEILRNSTGFPIPVSTRMFNPVEKGKKNVIYFFLDSRLAAEPVESYELTVSRDSVLLRAGNHEGIFMGMQTIRQLLPPEATREKKIITNVAWRIPAVVIRDKPRFSWRGMNLDCSRHFMTKDFILRYLDLLAYYKMNILHLHLTDDQGWRLEIKKYPKLTEIGAWRKEPGGTVHGGYYTREDIREIVEYARERFITVIPEIDMPGHCIAALAAYPRFSCTGKQLEVVPSWGIKQEVYCAGREETFEFIENVLDEVMDLFPSEYVHIGGDEVLKHRWKKCKRCQERIKKENLEGEVALQGYFMKRVARYVEDEGRKIIGWDEILEGGLASNAVVQSWRGISGAVEAVRQGHRAIVSPFDYTYFDYGLAKTDLKKVYSFDPVPPSLKKEETSMILGTEANMWTEYAPQETIDSKVFPRLLALSEVAWTYPAKRDFREFQARVKLHYRKLDALQVEYGAETESWIFSIKYFFRDVTAFFGILKEDPSLAMANLKMYFGMDDE